MKKSSINNRRGFTLVELLVAMSITLIITLMMAAVTATALDIYNKSRNEVRQARLASAAINQLTDDLEALVYRRDSNFNWLYLGEDPTDSGQEVAPIKSSNNPWLMFISAATDGYNQTGGGDISVLSYRLIYQDPIGGNSDFPLFSLYRQRIDPKESFEQLIGFPLVGEPNLKTAYNAATGGFAANAGNPKNFLVENVYEMSVTLIANIPIDANDLTQGYKIGRFSYFKQAASGGFSEIRLNGDGLVVTPASQLAQDAESIRSIEISLTVLTDEGSSILKNNPNYPPERLIAEKSKQYTTIIDLPAK